MCWAQGFNSCFLTSRASPKLYWSRIYTKNLIIYAKFITKQRWQYGFIFPCLNFNTRSCITSSGHCPVLAVWFSKSDASFPSLTSTSERMNPCRSSLTHPMLVKGEQTTLRFWTCCDNSYRSSSLTSNMLRVLQFTQSACGMPSDLCLLTA